MRPLLDRMLEPNVAADWLKLLAPADIPWAVHATNMDIRASRIIYALLPAFERRAEWSVPPIQRCPASRYAETAHYARRTKDPTRRQEPWTWVDSRAECGMVTELDEMFNGFECFMPLLKNGSKAPLIIFAQDEFKKRTIDD
jgi:hypothetical protein